MMKSTVRALNAQSSILHHKSHTQELDLDVVEDGDIADLLADLRHYCSQNNEDFDLLVQQSGTYHRDEILGGGK